jgi:hypothetical protein
MTSSRAAAELIPSRQVRRSPRFTSKPMEPGWSTLFKPAWNKGSESRLSPLKLIYLKVGSWLRSSDGSKEKANGAGESSGDRSLVS